MTIQLPVLIWTIIDFVLAMLILNKFLFKPYHLVMKNRESHIETQKKIYEDNLARSEAALEQAKQDAYDAEQDGLIRYKKAVAEAEKHASELLAEAQRKQEEELKKTEKALAEEKKEMLEQIEGQISDLSVRLADRLSA